MAINFLIDTYYRGNLTVIFYRIMLADSNREVWFRTDAIFYKYHVVTKENDSSEATFDCCSGAFPWVSRINVRRKQ